VADDKLALTCTVTNAQKDITTDVTWINNAKTLASDNSDITVTPSYASKTFKSVLSITHYNETDQARAFQIF